MAADKLDTQTQDLFTSRQSFTDAEGRRRRAPKEREGITLEDAATFVASATPIIGDAMAAKEVYDELQKDEPNYLLAGALGGAALVGLIPGLGDAAAAGIRRGAKMALDTAKRVEIDPNTLGTMGGNIRLNPKADVVDTTKPSVEAAGLTDEAIDSWRKANATSEDFRKALKGRNQELQDLANKIDDPDSPITVDDYRARADEIRPIRKVTDVPKPATYKEVVSALNAGKRNKPIIGLNAEIPEGDVITARLDIDAYTDYDVWVPTLTHPELKTVYKPTVVMKDVTFIDETSSAVKKAKGVAQGRPKAPFAVMTGKYQNISNDEAYDYATSVFDSDEWVQAGYDPTKRGFFYDRADGQPILAGEEVVQVGHLVLVKNATKGDSKAFGFNEGGMTVDNQTDVIFKSVRSYAEGGEVVDPVSGNEVPPGSLPEEVRDDIDARLSEGEYVVPADVVRYYGVKFFEDLRTKAKAGLEKMDEEGRIGGEPIGMEVIEPEDDFPFDVSELQTTEDIQGFDEGGDVTRMQNPFANSMGSSTEFKTYVNEQGLTLYIRFVDGKPMDYIPPGYVLEGTPSATESTTSVERESKDSSQTLAPPTESTGKSAKERLSAMSLDELTSAAKFTQKLRNPSVGIAAGALNPILGFAVRLGSGAKIADIDQELRSRLKNPDLTEEQRSQIETARSQFSYVDKEPKDGKPDSGQKLFGGYRSTYEGLKDNDGDGDIDFGDTWLGDLLGFDKDRKVGVQGIGLSESRAGARRYASIDEADEALGTLKDKASSVKAVPTAQPDTTYKYANPDGSARTVVDNAFTRTFNSANIGRNLDDVEKDNLARSAGVSREQYDNMSEYERSERLAGNAKGGLMTKSKKK